MRVRANLKSTFITRCHALLDYHLKKLIADSEPKENAAIRNFRIAAADGKSYNTKHYKFEGDGE